MFGRKKKETHIEAEANVGTINLGMAGYFGGHISHPDPEGVEIYLHDDRIEISFMKSISTLEIPYRDITSIEIITKADLLYSLFRGRYFPLPELVTYTKIQYKENSVDHYVVIDFDMGLQFALDFLNKKTAKLSVMFGIVLGITFFHFFLLPISRKYFYIYANYPIQRTGSSYTNLCFL